MLAPESRYAAQAAKVRQVCRSAKKALQVSQRHKKSANSRKDPSFQSLEDQTGSIVQSCLGFPLLLDFIYITFQSFVMSLINTDVYI